MPVKTVRGPRLVFVLKDGIRGHESQSAGIAWWLQRLAGSEILEIDIPGFSGFERFLRLKVLARRLRGGNGRVCSNWLDGSGGDGIRKLILERISTAGVKAKDVLFLSAGSSVAPWCLALSRVTGAKCCTIMTPSVLGTFPFDYAIVPEHDFPEPSPNILATLGAPNMIRPELLESSGALLTSRFPSNHEER
ncbi:MAG: ELM1/GtrOC1 family putative glycosyltransferase, partial [Thermovirgaceae bacterium]|nr:ELM1/GtrOC1 family putative glycosyltransferase [Thermovirgaceae bacterium]